MALCSSSLCPFPFRLPPTTPPLSSPLFSPFAFRTSPRFPSLRTGAGRGRSRGQAPREPDLIRKPSIPTSDEGSELSTGLEENGNHRYSEYYQWVDWEDQILEETVPLVRFVRMILLSGRYESGDRLCAEHEKTVLEKLLKYHPESEKKIGCGIDFITIGYHPDFENSRCLFIVRKDGELVDFSYWKCIKGLIKKNYPLYADSFILKHFRRRDNELRKPL